MSNLWTLKKIFPDDIPEIAKNSQFSFRWQGDMLTFQNSRNSYSHWNLADPEGEVAVQ